MNCTKASCQRRGTSGVAAPRDGGGAGGGARQAALCAKGEPPQQRAIPHVASGLPRGAARAAPQPRPPASSPKKVYDMRFAVREETMNKTMLRGCDIVVGGIRPSTQQDRRLRMV